MSHPDLNDAHEAAILEERRACLIHERDRVGCPTCDALDYVTLRARLAEAEAALSEACALLAGVETHSGARLADHPTIAAFLACHRKEGT